MLLHLRSLFLFFRAPVGDSQSLISSAKDFQLVQLRSDSPALPAAGGPEGHSGDGKRRNLAAMVTVGGTLSGKEPSGMEMKVQAKTWLCRMFRSCLGFLLYSKTSCEMIEKC